MKTYHFHSAGFSGILQLRCFCAPPTVKDHRYFSVVENRRLSSGKTAQRVLELLVVNHATYGLAAVRQALLPELVQPQLAP